LVESSACFTGPAKEQLFAYGLHVLLIGSVASNLLLFLPFFVELEEQGLQVLSGFFALWGLLCYYYLLRAQFTDPGVLPAHQTRDEEEDFKYFYLYDGHTEDMVYRQCNLYTYRNCNTCAIERPPKASHCRLCNHCVRGFDQ